MSNLVVIAYPNEPGKAAEVSQTLARLQAEYLIDLEDSVYVVKDAQGKVSLHQANNLPGAGAATGALWGLLFGLLFFVPVFGVAIGAGTGWLMGKLSDYGVDDKFVKQLSQTLGPNSSAIFVLVRRATPDKVVPEVARFGGVVLQTSLSREADEELRTAIAGGGAAQPTTASQPDTSQGTQA